MKGQYVHLLEAVHRRRQKNILRLITVNRRVNNYNNSTGIVIHIHRIFVIMRA